MILISFQFLPIDSIVIVNLLLKTYFTQINVIPHKSAVLNLVYFACCVSPMNKYIHYLSSLCILVSTRCSCTYSPHIEADFSSWGGFKTDGKPSKGSTYLSLTNIPMMANYPSYTATCLTSTTSTDVWWGRGGTGRPRVLLLWCCCVCFQISAFTVQSFVPQTATRLTGTRWISKRSVLSRLHSLKRSSQFVCTSPVVGKYSI